MSLRSLPPFLLSALALLISPVASARSRAAAHPGPAPRPEHVFVVVLENTNAADALAQPFLRRLATEGALLANYSAITHPSQPNYLALVAGDTFGASDNATTLDASHLGDLLEAKDLDWKVYAADYPGNCFLGSSSGAYVRRHVPFLSFANVQQQAARCSAHVVNATQLDADLAATSLPAFAMYIPNDTDNGHDTSVATADRWMESRFGPLLTDPHFTTGTVFIVLFDESNTTANNLVYAVIWGSNVRSGAASQQPYDHYSMLRTIESLLGLGSLGRHDATASVISDVWK